jgi:hypothetical protein
MGISPRRYTEIGLLWYGRTHGNDLDDALEDEDGGEHSLGVAAQLEFESKIEANLKADDHISVSSALFQAVSTRVS